MRPGAAVDLVNVGDERRSNKSERFLSRYGAAFGGEESGSWTPRDVTRIGHVIDWESIAELTETTWEIEAQHRRRQL